MTREEFKKKWKIGEEENSSPSSSKGGAITQRYLREKYAKAYEEGASALNDIYSGWQNPEQGAHNMNTARNAIKSLSDIGGQYGDTSFGNHISTLVDNYLGADDALNAYSGYMTADAYNKAQKKFDFANKYRGASYDDIQKALSSVTDLDEQKFLKGYTDYSSLEDFDKAIEAEEKIRQSIRNGKNVKSVYQNNLKEARNYFERTHAGEAYEDLVNKADYEELSKDASDLDRYEKSIALDPIRLMTRGNVAFSDSLSEADREKAIYLYNKDLANGVDPTSKDSQYLQYMKDMTFIARQNEASEMQRDLTEQREEHPVLSAIEYPLFNAFMGGAAGIESLVSVARGNTDPTGLGTLTNAISQQTAQISQNIKENAGGLPAFAYDVFATGVPNRIGQMMYGKAYNAIMGTQVFASAYTEAVQNGVSPEKAIADALVQGGLEFLTEWKGMEWAFGEGSNAITKILKQAFAEGSEEVVSSLGNLIYDINVNGGKAEYYQNVNNYMQMGYSPEEARKKASTDYIKDVAYQFAVAAFSTVPTTGTAEVARVAQESSAGKFVNREKIAEITDENLQKKYGEEWAKKATNREIYKAYGNYVEGLQNESTKAEKEATRKAIAEEYKMTEDQADKWVEALYNGDKKLLKTGLGAMLTNDVRQNKGFAQRIDSTETDKIATKIRDAFKMIKSDNEMAADKASKAIKTGEKNLVNGKEAEIISMKENKDGSYTVKTSEGNVKASDVTVTENKATALTYSANIENETLKEAYVHYYNGEDIADYDTYARYLYQAGRQGVDYSDETQILDALGKAKAQAFYNIGSMEALQEEIEDSKALEEVTKKYKEKYRPGTFKSGEYKNGKFKENKDFFRNLNRTQKKLYRIVESFSSLSGINVRVYIDREAASENGQFIAGRNGGTIYINLAARPFADNAYGINQYVISTLSHELTHWLKANNREAYDILEEAVKKDLQKNNTLDKRLSTERETLLKTHENELKEAGKSEEEIKAELEKYSKKKDLEEIAMEEVVARACEDMLNDSDTMEEVLSFADQDGLTKLQNALKKWFDHIRQFFNDLMGGFHAPNEVVADLQKSYDHLRELWVKGMKEAIAQNRKEQKTTERKTKLDSKYNLKVKAADGKIYTAIEIDSEKTKKIINNDKAFKNFVLSLANKTITVYNEDGSSELITFARENEKVYKGGKHSHPALGELVYMAGDYRKATLVNIKNALVVSKQIDESEESSHGWLDERGWKTRRAYVKSDGMLYPADLRIGKARDGRNILYAINLDIKKGFAADKESTQGGYVADTNPLNDILSQPNKQRNNKSVKSVKLSEMGYTEVAEDKLGLDDARIDKLLTSDYYGSSNPKFAPAYIAHISPDQFLKLTTSSQKSFETVSKWSDSVFSSVTGDFNLKELGDRYNRLPMQLTITERENGNFIEGHDGRHRMAQLKAMGYNQVPVFIFNRDNDYGKEPHKVLGLHSQFYDEDDNDAYTKDIIYLENVIPFSSGNAKLIKDTFGSGSKSKTMLSVKMDSEGRTLSEGQQSYFEDSKARDDQGRLLVMYHGTDSYEDFTVFKAGKDGYLGKGIYFTEKESIAKRYAEQNGYKGRIYKVYLNVKNPLIVTSENPALEILGEKVAKRRAEKNSFSTKWLTSADIKKLQAKGYDGIIWKYGESPVEISVWDSNQIKLTTNENPTSDKDIRRSVKMDSEGRTLSEGQQKYFEKSVIRDENGNLLLVRHGTKDAFTVFNPIGKGGQNGTAEGFGIYFSDDIEVTNKYGDIQLEGYLNITKPAYDNKKTITKADLVKLIKATTKYEVDEWGEDERDTWISNYVNTYETTLERAYAEVAQNILRLNGNDKDIIQEIMVGMGIRTYESAYEFYDILTNTLGFDGIVVKWQHNDGESNVFVAFNSEQFKNKTNLNPTTNPDIRKSVRLDSVETIGAADVDTKTGTAVYSVRYTLAERYKELGYNSYAEAVGKTAADIAEKMGVSKLKAEQWIKAEESLASLILKDAENQRYLDYVADNRYSAIKTDTDYPQGTIDLSNLCRKREIFTKMFDSLQRENPDILFTAEDIAKIRQILTEANYEVACALCYVEDRRQKIGEISQSFIDNYKKALESKTKVIYRTNSKGKVKPLKITKKQAATYDLTQGDYFKAVDPYVPNQYDLTTYQGYKELTEKHPMVAAAFENFNNARGQSAARLIEGHAEYKREILNWSEADVNKANNLGGLRVFSFSDFEAIHLIDIVQVVMDCSTKGVMIQAYTKVPSFANLVKDTGIKLNRSLIPANVGSKNAYAYVNGKAVKIDSDMWVEDGIALVDGKEVLAFDTVEGIDITDENFLDMSDNHNVGNILVGISEKQIRLAMEDDFIDYIIPFHSNQAKSILEAKGIHKWDNYKLSQLDKKVNGKGKDHGINIYTDVINKYKIRNKNDFVRAFLNECKNQKYKPRFEEFLKKNSKGDYIYTEGYHKFLVDYKLFDKNGNILKQEAVKPDFDQELMNRILMADKARSMNMKFSDEIMDKVKKELSIDSRKSVKLNSEGNPLSEGQQNYFKNSKVVDNQGRLKVMYHGSPEASFTVFNPEFSDDEISLFFVDNEEVAMGYAGTDKYVDTNNLRKKEAIKTLAQLQNLLKDYNFSARKDGNEIVIERKDGDETWEYVRADSVEHAYVDWIYNYTEGGENEIYGGVYEVYLNVENPLIVDAEGDLWDEIVPSELLDEDNTKVYSYIHTLKKIDDSVIVEWEESDTWARKTKLMTPEQIREQFGDTLYNKYVKEGKLWEGKVYLNKDGSLLPRNTREFATYAKEHGYDGVIINDLIDEGEYSIRDNVAQVVIAFNSNQVKSIYNENPTEDQDILKSTKLSPEAQRLVDELTLENKRLTEENTALKVEKGIEKAKAEKKALIDKITEQSQVLSRWLLTNDKNNPVPQAIKEPLGKLLTSINFTKDDYEWRKSKGQLTKAEESLGQRMAKISQLLLEIDQDKVVDKEAYDLSQLDWLPTFSKEFVQIKDAVAAAEAREGETFTLSRMSTEDLQNLSNMITALKTAITNMNKCMSAHNKMSVSGIGKAIVDYLDEVGQKKKDNRVLQFLEIDNTVPFYFFKRLGSGGQTAFKLLMDGMNQYAFEAKLIEDYAKKTFSGKDVNAWRDQVKTFEIDQIEYSAEQGENLVQSHKTTIRMTVPQIMSLYCLSKRDQAQNHLQSGGIRIGDFRVKNEKEPVHQVDNVTLTKADLQKIISSLDEDQKNVADKLQEFMNTTLQKWGNEITMKRFGFKGMTEKNYFPIIVDRNVLSSQARQKGTSLYQLLNMGFTKPINPKAKNPIEIFDIFEVFAMHSTEMAQYHSLALPVLDVIRIWNYKDLEMLDEGENKAHWHSVKSSIEKTIGAKGNQYIGRLLADLNGDVSGGRADDLASRFMKNYKTAAVAANLQVVALQPLSYIRAGYMIDSKYLTKGMAMKSTDDALKWCGIAVWKDMGFYNTAIHRGLEHKIMQDETKKESIIEKGLYLAGKADGWTWSKLWNACLLETKDKYPNLEGDDLYKKTADRLTEVIYGTQVVDSILTRSEIMRDPTFYSKMITAFQSEPTLALNVLMDAGESFSMEARAHGKQAALQKHGATIRRAATVYLISSAVESALRAVIGKIRGYDGDDDDETIVENFFKRFIEELNPLRKIPLIKDAWSVLIDGIKVLMGKQYRIYTDTRMDEAIFENIGKAVIRMFKLIEGKEVNFKVLYEIAKGLDASGLPVSSTFRAFKVLWNNTIGRIWESLLLK